MLSNLPTILLNLTASRVICQTLNFSNFNMNWLQNDRKSSVNISNPLICQQQPRPKTIDFRSFIIIDEPDKEDYVIFKQYFTLNIITIPASFPFSEVHEVPLQRMTDILTDDLHDETTDYIFIFILTP